MLQVVQGDVFEFGVDFCNLAPMFIDRVVFTSKKLGLQETAMFENGEYRVRIDGGRTRLFPAGFIGYDVTVILTDGERLTVRSNEKIEVLRKCNEVQNE